MDFLGGSIGKVENKEEIIKSLQRIQMSEAEIDFNFLPTLCNFYTDKSGFIFKYKSVIS